MAKQNRGPIGAAIAPHSTETLAACADLLKAIEGIAKGSLSNMLVGLNNDEKSNLAGHLAYWKAVARGMKWGRSYIVKEIARRTAHANQSSGRSVRPDHSPRGQRIRASRKAS